MRKSSTLYRKRIIVFGFEGKNNKTETIYFSHFKPTDERYIIKLISCGVTDPVNMINSIKSKRKDFDYNSREDLTFLFVDGDCDKNKNELIEKLKEKQPKDIKIIKSNPCFELWFLNHFCKTTKEFCNNDELIQELKKYIPNYNKNYDCFDYLKDRTNKAIENSLNQLSTSECRSTTDVQYLINSILKIYE